MLLGFRVKFRVSVVLGFRVSVVLWFRVEGFCAF